MNVLEEYIEIFFLNSVWTITVAHDYYTEAMVSITVKVAAGPKGASVKQRVSAASDIFVSRSR
jgi:hypothetical protein